MLKSNHVNTVFPVVIFIIINYDTDTGLLEGFNDDKNTQKHPLRADNLTPRTKTKSICDDFLIIEIIYIFRRGLLAREPFTETFWTTDFSLI